MISASIEIKKIDVYNEVAKTTSYVGAKKEEDEGAYERIFTADADREILERFWNECCDDVTSMFKPFITSVSAQDSTGVANLENNYTLELELSSSFDISLLSMLESVLNSYFITGITSKWFELTNKEEVEKYSAEAIGYMESVRENLYFRKKPKRVAPSKTV